MQLKVGVSCRFRRPPASSHDDDDNGQRCGCGEEGKEAAAAENVKLISELLISEEKVPSKAAKRRRDKNHSER